MKKRALFLTLISMMICFLIVVMSIAKTSLPANKQTVLGKYVTAKEAYEMYTTSPETVKILDVRTIGEYTFVGHASMAVNIPLMFLKPGITATNKPIMLMNENFVAEVKNKFNNDDTILAICRSGGRSAFCANKLAKAGFTNIYTIVDGFEGDKDTEGKRTVNGWINSGIPWTYGLNPKLVYSPS